MNMIYNFDLNDLKYILKIYYLNNYKKLILFDIIFKIYNNIMLNFIA